ncbi:hypothetical protein HGRIS_012501 [Hohenbuehelia grisea]|uniref:Zn(2)-C6 fungal-type domain-containing protein n=1 Tax=Hohenbuehelia grisea TaxID=104357 RepID=A0ABR3ISK1_9AGAR
MPQAQRKETQRAQDKETKRAKGALSCAECRRLKLKCDKKVPCSSCQRRGCAAICPNGSLITGQGTRFVLADTEKLHQKIALMSDRIRQLEDALAILQSAHTAEPHPLLHRDLLQVKSSIELHSAVDSEDGPADQEEIEESQYIDAFGTLAIHDDGAATFYGRSAGQESLLIGEASQAESSSSQHGTPGQIWQNVPSSISEMSQTFPLSAGPLAGLDLEHMVEHYLPPWPEAWRLCELYLQQAPWFFGAVTKRQLHEEILPLWYQEAQGMVTSPNPAHSHTPSGSALPVASSNAIRPQNKGSAHDLALLAILFCFGALTDNELPPAPDNTVATQYYQLTRASLSLEPVLERPPSVATVQALSLMAIYEGLCSGENSIESTWALMGLATKLAQSIGLHRDSARWNLPPAEVQKRRALFWELFITDCWQSLATGRLATFSLPFVDCELPADPDQIWSSDGSPQPSFPFWKARFGAECVSAVVQGTLTSRAPRYSIIKELDRKVRDMELPRYAQEPPREGASLGEAMSHFMPINYRELTLLYIHRCFFAHAIETHPHDPIKSPYAPSFLAGYRSACNLIAALRKQFDRFPRQIARFWVLWTHAFSSAVMLSSVVIHSTKSKVARAAFVELEAALELFTNAAAYGGRAVKFLPIIQRLYTKAQNVSSHMGGPQPNPNDIFAPSTSRDVKTEMGIFSGKTHTVAKVSSGRQGNPSPAPSRSASDSPKNVTANPAFADVHPNLVEQLNYFESDIHVRIQNAYAAAEQDPYERIAVSGQTVSQNVGQPPLPTSSVHQSSYHQTTGQPRQASQGSYSSQSHQQQHSPSPPYVPQVSQPNTSQYHRDNSYHQSEPQQYSQMHQMPRQRQQTNRQLQAESQRAYEQPQHQLHQLQTQDALVQSYQQQPFQQSIHATVTISTEPHITRAAPAPAAVNRQPNLSQARSQPNLQAAYNQYQYAAAEQYAQRSVPHQSQPSVTQHHQSQQMQSGPAHQLYNVAQVSDSIMTPTSDDSGRGSHYSSPTATTAMYNVSQVQVQAQAAPSPAGYYPTTSMAHYATFGHQAESQAPQQYAPLQYYTPDNAMRGLAAEDNSLQETWQSYMNQVGSPRQIQHLAE